MIPLQTAISRFAETSFFTGIILSLFLPLRSLLRRVVGSQWLGIIWLLVLGRLLFPFSIESRWSVLNIWYYSHPGHTLAQQPPAMIMNAPEKERPAFEKGVTAGATNLDYVSSQTNSVVKSAPGAIDWLCRIWAGGVIASLSVLALQMRRTRILAAQTYRATDPRLLELFESIDAKLRGNVELRMTEALSVPTLAGMRHPQIWVPATWPEQLAADEMRHVLLHELGHAHRRDLVVQWLFSVAQCLHWFNPLVWLAARFARFDRELACDAWVMKRMDVKDAPRYGLTLVKIVRLLCVPTSASPGLIEMATSKKALATRVRAIGAFRRISTLHGILGVIATLAGLTIMTAVGSPPIDPASPSPAAKSTSPPNPAAEPSKNDSSFHIEIETTFVEVTEAAAKRLKNKPGMHLAFLFTEDFTPGPANSGKMSLAGVLNGQNRDMVMRELSGEEGVRISKTNKALVIPGEPSRFDWPVDTPNAKGLIVKPNLNKVHETIDLDITRSSIPGSDDRGSTTSNSIWSGQAAVLSSIEVTRANDEGKAMETCRVLLFVTGKIVDSEGRPVSLKPHQPWINISAKFIELTDEAVEKLKLDSVIQPAPAFSKETTAGIREDAQIQILLKSLNHQKGVDLLSAPSATTISGQRVVIEVIREYRAPSTWKKDPQKPDGWLPNEFETTNIGATLEAVPELRPDGMISVYLSPKLVEFLGMDDIETGKPVPADGEVSHPTMSNGDFHLTWPNYHYEPGHRNNSVFSKLSAPGLVTLISGQSVLLVLKETVDTRPFQESASKNHVLVIVTAQTVDSVKGDPVPVTPKP